MTVRLARTEDAEGIVSLQPDAFPPPFNPAYHWRPSHIRRQIEIFPDAQFVIEDAGRIVAACSNERLILDAIDWSDWMSVTGGPYIQGHIPTGDAIFGLDIAVANTHRRRGLGRQLYEARFRYVRENDLRAFVTGCRVPDYSKWEGPADEYQRLVSKGALVDRTLTPLLRMGMTHVRPLPDFMDDPESLNFCALIQWTP